MLGELPGHALAKRRGLGVPWMDEASEVDQAADEPGERPPAVVARAQRRLLERDARAPRGELSGETRVARVLLEHREGEVDLVATIGQELDRRPVEAQEAGVQHEE